MYKAKESFKSVLGTKHKGDKVDPPNAEVAKLWLNAGLIVETKPEEKPELETKPQPRKGKGKKK